MPSTQHDHWSYTIEEWQKLPFTELTAAMPDHLKVVYDIGANVGGWAHVMQRKYHERLDMHCFEPVLANFNALCENMPKAHNHHYGIFYGARDSHVVARGQYGNVGAYFVEQIDAGEPRVIFEEVIKLKTLEELELPLPDLIKMDVEGAEENIIERSTMVKECKWLVIEWHPNKSAIEFFKQHLPNHRVVVNLQNMQFLLCLKK